MHATQSRRGFLSSMAAIALLGVLTPTVFAAPQSAAPPTASKKEVATFAAGCFWSMEAIFKQLKGVSRAEPGYAGGKTTRPSYEEVETGTTGHAETVNIVFDPTVISYSDLLQVLLTIRNPTTLNKQGPDEGTQYRSIIFYRTPEQKKAAEEAIQKITLEHVWKAPIVTEVVPYTNFYPAENYHKNYYSLHQNESYCKYVVAPEIKEFRTKFRDLLKR